MSILAVAGDVGGARAVIPVLDYLASVGESLTIVDYGFLTNEAPNSWKRTPAILRGKDSLEHLFDTERFKVLIFATSVKDAFPLRVAQLARRFGVYVICLLDNWMNYRHRLRMNGQQVFLPDLYMVMDALAFEGACADGIPASILRVIGQPALASLGEEYRKWSMEDRRRKFEALGLREEKKLIVFISEPAEADQGSGPEFPRYRGYTEKTVLRELCARLQPFSDKCQLGIVRHPREQFDGLNKLWQECHGTLRGGLLEIDKGRQAVFLADGVAGMASILLYEAWLINKPVISLQPGLCKPQLNVMEQREGIFCITSAAEWDAVMREWMDEVDKLGESLGFKKDLELHVQAARNAGGIIVDYLNNGNTGEQFV